MRKLWWRLKTEPHTRIAFVLDASGAQPDWQKICSLTRDLLNTLPGATKVKIFFLGNAEPLAKTQLERNMDLFYQKNRGRASIINPVFEQLEAEDETTILVLGAGRIFDAEDWRDTPLLQRTLFVRCGDQTLTGGLCHEWEPGSEQLQSQLYNPVTRVVLSGQGLMPFFWNNAAYHLNDTMLTAEQAESYAVQVGFLSAREGQPEALATLANGATRLLPLQECEPPLLHYTWKAVSQQETEVFRQCQQQGNYRCPICGDEHPGTQLKCDQFKTRILGTPIYASFREMRGFVLLRDSDERVEFYSYPHATLLIGEESVAVQRGGSAEIYCFHAASGEWRNTGEKMKQYHPLGENTYAIIL